MADVPRRNPRQLDMDLANARQTLTLLRSQAQAGKVDTAFLDQKLDSINQLMVAIEDERKQTVQQERLAKLYQVSRVIGSSLDLQTVLNQVMDAIIQLTSAERGFLMLLDDDDNLVVRVARNFSRETLDSSDFALSRTVTKQVLDTSQPIVTTNAQEDARFAGKVSIMSYGLRSIMASPLRVRGKVIGVVYVDNRVKTGLFSEKDLDVLDTFAGQAAVAIDNARLFSATDKALNARVDELTELQRFDRQLNETLDTTKAINIALEWSSRLCKARSASMALVEPGVDTLRVVAHCGEPDILTSGTTALEVNHPAFKKIVETQEPLYQKITTPTPAAMLFVPVRREGKVIGVIAMTAPEPDAFPPDTRAFASRLADRAAIAIENARLYDAVKAANNAKSEFVSLVAHELKLPMTSIQGYADLLTMAGAVNDRQMQFIMTIKNAVNRMKVLVSDLSDISRIESGNLRIQPTNVSVIEAINSAVESTATEISNRQHKLTTEIEPNLPQVKADKDRLAQVMLNLISNAYKYTPNGGTITVKARKQDNEVVISVSDSGVGMTPEQLAKLGTKFWRADNNLQQPGTGLGFAITRNLIELMQGKLTIQSEPGKGSTFTFILPCAEAEATKPTVEGNDKRE